MIGANHLRNEEVAGLVCVARDITRRRMWEVAGTDVARFQQVVQHSPSITLLLDGDGVVTSVNGAFTRLLAFDPSVVIGETLETFVAGESCRRCGTYSTRWAVAAAGSRWNWR